MKPLRDAAAKRKEDIARIVQEAHTLLDKNLDVDILIRGMHSQSEGVPHEKEPAEILSMETQWRLNSQTVTMSTDTNAIDFELMAFPDLSNAPSYSPTSRLTNESSSATSHYLDHSPSGSSDPTTQTQGWPNVTAADYTNSAW